MKMKAFKVAMIMAVTAVMVLCACSSKSKKNRGEEASDSKSIICYFSASGVTAKAAQRIADLTGFPVYEIVPESIYTEADLDWRDSLSRSSVEMRDFSIRPALKDSVTDLSEYSVVFLGYPNWWNTHPTIINTFIESNDLQGKTIVPFMTSGGSNIINSEQKLREQYPDLTFGKGLLMNDVSDEDIEKWVKEVEK
ncbi:MAG: flavodoxin [Muribaculaceae bacterium]|nr:flavodoxin [Muribaculaceae bacterium]